MSIKNQAISGVKWTSLSTFVNTGVQFIQTAILARFLSPSDYGLMAMASIAIGLTSNFIDMGVSNAIISKKDITSRQLSSLYWLNVFSGFLFFLLISLCSPLIANFYDESELIPIIILISTTFVITSFSSQYNALYSKELKFDFLAKRAVISQFFSLASSVTLAYLDYGVYSLVFSNILTSLVSSLLIISNGLKFHKPTFVFKLGEIREFLGFGLYQMGEKILNYFNSEIDSLVVGKLLGAEILGFYTIAKSLIMRPAQIINPIITKVTFPLMSKVNNDDNMLKRIYLKTLNYTSSLNFPVYVILIVLSEPVILIVYGPRWSESILMLQLLSVYAIVRSVISPVGTLLISKGKARLAFNWNLIVFIFIPLSIYFGSFWGIFGVIHSRIILQTLFFYPSFHFLVKKVIDINVQEYLRELAIPFFTSWLILIVGLGFSYLIEPVWIKFFSILPILTLIYIALSFKYNRSFINTFMSLITFFKSKKNV